MKGNDQRSKPFRLALIGAGMITRGSHLPAALASSLIEVTALVDPVVQRAEDLAREYGIRARTASAVDEVIGEIDGAVIATPNDTHGALAVRCLDAGVPVLIEKPLAQSHGEGLAVVSAAERSGKVAAVGYSTRFRDNVTLLKRLLDQGYFGGVRRFVHQFGTSGGWAPFSAYNLSRASAGGGVLIVTGTHFLDRMLHLWGYPDEARLEDDALGGPEANCTARFRYVRGASSFEGAARYSKTDHLPAGMVIETDRGYVVLRDTDDADIVLRPEAATDVETIIRPGNRKAPPDGRCVFQRQLEDFVMACRDKRPPAVDARQGLLSLALLEQLYANRSGVESDWYSKPAARLAA